MADDQAPAKTIAQTAPATTAVTGAGGSVAGSGGSVAGSGGSVAKSAKPVVPTFTASELEIAFNALRARISADGGLVAHDLDDKPLPVERMTPVQRAAFEKMDALHRVPKK